jgi:hypothetical protein
MPGSFVSTRKHVMPDCFFSLEVVRVTSRQ